MNKRNGADVHIVYPLVDDEARAAAAEKGALTRSSVKALFPSDDSYFRVFADIQPDQIIAAFFRNRPVGVLLITRNGAEPFKVSRQRFCEVWGDVWGRWYWTKFRLRQLFYELPGVYCSAVWVHPVWRGKGLGARLYQTLIDETDGPVYAFARHEAVRFHEKVGFRSIGGLFWRMIGRITAARPMAVPARRERGGAEP